MINADNADKTQTAASAAEIVAAHGFEPLTQTVDNRHTPDADWLKSIGGVSTCLR